MVRTAGSGSVYKDTDGDLSESGREVVLVFALSGYLVHEVHEQLPFMLLDSLEALDSERIQVFVNHLPLHVSSLVVSLLPEDAEAVNAGYERVTEI